MPNCRPASPRPFLLCEAGEGTARRAGGGDRCGAAQGSSQAAPEATTGDTGAPSEIGEADNLQVLRKPLDPMRLRMLLGALKR